VKKVYEVQSLLKPMPNLSIREELANILVACSAGVYSFLPSIFMGAGEEKARDETPNNDVMDLRYQKFAASVVGGIIKAFSSNHKGLNFG
jgi:hypothetical protein